MTEPRYDYYYLTYAISGGKAFGARVVPQESHEGQEFDLARWTLHVIALEQTVCVILSWRLVSKAQYEKWCEICRRINPGKPQLRVVPVPSPSQPEPPKGDPA